MYNKTLNYYNQNAIRFANNTLNVEFSTIQNKFLYYLNKGDLILDFGCGAGRDIQYFLSHGFEVEAIDGSEELCEIASKYSGIEVKHMYFQEFNESDKYDGIWACASLLHLNQQELIEVLHKLVKSMKNNSIFYVSFKYGTFEGMRNGRYFNDMNEEKFMEIIKDIPNLEIVDKWITDDARSERSDEKWMNFFMKKR